VLLHPGEPDGGHRGPARHERGRLPRAGVRARRRVRATPAHEAIRDDRVTRRDKRLEVLAGVDGDPQVVAALIRLNSGPRLSPQKRERLRLLAALVGHLPLDLVDLERRRAAPTKVRWHDTGVVVGLNGMAFV